MGEDDRYVDPSRLTRIGWFFWRNWNRLLCATRGHGVESNGICRRCGLPIGPFEDDPALARGGGAVICPRCKGKGTVVKDGPSEWEYDSHYPCPTCTTDRTALRGTGQVPDHASAAQIDHRATCSCPSCRAEGIAPLSDNQR